MRRGYSGIRVSERHRACACVVISTAVRFVLAPYTLRTDPRIAIAAGFQRIEAALLHITAGLGHTIPLRFLCPPEVVWLDCAPSVDSIEVERAA